MSLIRRKYDLPDIAKIPHVQFDIKKLQQELKKLQPFWSNVFEANSGLVSLNEQLARDVYDSFDQIALTWYEPLSMKEAKESALGKLKSRLPKPSPKPSSLSQSLSSPLSSPPLNMKARETPIKSQRPRLSAAESYREKTKGREGLLKQMNEHNWHHPLPYYKDSYIEKALARFFKSRPIRVRLTRLKKAQAVTPHIDYCPSYAVRIIVPIQGTEGVINTVERRGKINKYHLKADGSAWFINVGFRHSVLHKGKEDRIALMFSLSDQQDLEGIKSLEAIKSPSFA